MSPDLAAGSAPTAAFRGPMFAGFSSGIHRPRRGTVLDHAVLTAHDRFATLDYARLHALGIRTVHESARWPAVERRAWRYDFSALAPCVRAARALDMDIVWTLLDGSWPEDLAPMRPALVRRLAMFARALARFLREETERAPVIVPVEAVAARAWLGGELGRAEPFLEDRGLELQAQLARAAIAAVEAFRAVTPAARVLSAEPLFHVAADRIEDVDAADAAADRRCGGLDMLCGRAWPQLGGDARHLDLVGVTVEPNWQWYYRGPKFPGPPIPPGAPGWRPLRQLLTELARRYQRPIVIAATARAGAFGPPWLRHVCRETRAAILDGATVAGVGLAPVLQCGGEDRGVWGAADEIGRRAIDAPLAEEVVVQRACFERFGASLRAARAAAATANATLEAKALQRAAS